MEYTKLMASYAVQLRFEDLPQEVVEQAKLLTLQVIGASLASIQEGQAQRAITMVRDNGGKPESTIWGDGTKVPSEEAAFVNATMADILDWEDCSWTGHPGAGVVPVGLALGELMKASGKDYIAALVAGYEVYQRIAMSVQPSKQMIIRTKTWGLVSWQIYASVISAAKLLNLSKEKIAQALGVANYQVAVPCSKHGVKPRSDVYHYAHGFCARDGITSALIAQSGIDGMYDSLDGDNGYWAMVSDQVDWSWLRMGLGKEYLIMEDLFKHWPANVWIQAPLDALDAMVKEHQIKPDDVVEITVSPDLERMMQHCPEGYPGLLDAEFSIPFCFAAYLLDQNPGPNWYDLQKLKDPKVIELAGRVKGTGPKTTPLDNFSYFWKRSFPETTVTVTLKDKRQFVKTLLYPKGHPRNRMTINEFERRFRRAASFSLKPDKVERLMEKILKLEKEDDVSEITELMF